MSGTSGGTNAAIDAMYYTSKKMGYPPPPPPTAEHSNPRFLRSQIRSSEASIRDIKRELKRWLIHDCGSVSDFYYLSNIQRIVCQERWITEYRFYLAAAEAGIVGHRKN